MRDLSTFFMVGFTIALCSLPVEAQTFNSHVTVSVAQQTYSYTVFNDEAAGSSLYNTNFTLSLLNATPFVVTGTPTGWSFATDNQNLVYWYNTDPSLPYPHDIAPGAFLGGFSIQATGPSSPQNISFETDAWDHSVDNFGASLTGTILGPQAAAAVPEASSKELLGFGLMTFSFSGLGLKAWRRARKQV